MTPEALARVHARAFDGQGRAWDAGEFRDLLDSDFVFAVGDERAFALGRAVAGEAELLTLACDPACRRQGLGRACLAAFEAEALARGAVRFLLEVAAGNVAALALYHGAGYIEVARRAGYYSMPDGTRQDAMTLEKAVD